MTYAELIHGIQNSIKNEYEDYRYYVELAKKTANIKEKEILMQIAKDEKRHAYTLKEAYFKLTGRIPMESTAETFFISEYKESLKQRILAETESGEKYREFYINTKIDWLRDKFLRIMNDESEHTAKVSLLINNVNEEEISVLARQIAGRFKKKI